MDDRVAETGRLRALRWMHAEVPRLALGMYFVNACLQDLQLWHSGNGRFPFVSTAMLAPAAVMMAPDRALRAELRSLL